MTIFKVKGSISIAIVSWLALIVSIIALGFTIKQYYDFDKKTSYLITIKTSNHYKDAGTDGYVFITLKGDKGESERKLLDNKKKDEHNKDAEDKHEIITLRNLGEIEELIIEHENENKESTWLLQKITVKDTNENISWVFCNSEEIWLKDTKTERRRVLVLKPKKCK